MICQITLGSNRYHSDVRYAYFSSRTPLNLPPLVFTSMNCPVVTSRLVYNPVFGLRTCERSLTAPIRRLSPVGLLVAIHS